MSLPPAYKHLTEYFKDCLDFLESHQWMYNYNNTHILVNNVFSNFSPEWLEYFRSLTYEAFNKVLLNDTGENCPQSFKKILNTIVSLTPRMCLSTSREYDVALPHNSGVSGKKLHEILHLSPLVKEVCHENGANFIIDIGSGLGYLSHLLNNRYNYPVLGIECSSKYIRFAYKNQDKYYKEANKKVIFVQHYIDRNSSEKILEFSSVNFGPIKSISGCIVGLHACADLSVTTLELFTKLDFVRSLIIMPCCYHRLNLLNSDGSTEYFENFPASDKLKEHFQVASAETFLRRPFLRVACQQAIGRFIHMSQEQHEEHSRGLIFRAILQDVAESEGYQVCRLKRKSGLKSTPPDPDEHFQLYLNNLKRSHKLISTNAQPALEIDDGELMEKMREKWNENKEKCLLAEILTALQASIQSLCENLLLLDRVEFLKERGFRCEVRKVTDDVTSPRCYALVAEKN